MSSFSKGFKQFAVVASFICSLVLIATIGAAPAKADNLFFCNGCTAAPSGDPELLTSVTGFQMGLSGGKSSVAPVLVIIGSYNGAPAPTVKVGSTSFSPGGTAIYGWNGSASGVPFNSSSSDVYTTLGLAPASGGPSEQFSKWNTGETDNGFAAASSFTLYVYELTGISFPGTGTNEITLSVIGGTTGDYIVGYACEVSGTPCQSGKDGSTPFTTVGLDGAPPTTMTPEPGTLLLFGTGMLGLAGLVRKRFTS